MIKPGALVMAAVMAAVTAGTYFGLDRVPAGLLPPPVGRIPPAPLHAVSQDTTIASAMAAPLAPPTAPPTAPPAATVATADPAPAAAPTEQELAEEPAPKPAPAPEPKAAAAKPAPSIPAEAVPVPPKEKAPEPAPQKAAAAAEPEAPKTPSKTSAEADVIKQWWPEASKLPANQLKLIYAGEVQGEPAIGLLFSDAPKMESLKLHAKVRDVTGADVSGTWEAGKNPKLVVFRGVQSGRYTVILEPELADVRGFALGLTLQGPVYIPTH